MTLKTILKDKVPLNIIFDVPFFSKPKWFDDYYISPDRFRFELLGVLVKKEKKQFAFKAADKKIKEEPFGNTPQREVLTCTVNITESDQLIDLKIIKNELQFLKDTKYPYLRNVIPCYKLSYREISVSEKNIPSGCDMLTKLSSWFDDFLFLPTTKAKILSQELDIIFNFYNFQKIVKNNLSEDDFKRMYKDMWYEIGMIDESDRIITF